MTRFAAGQERGRLVRQATVTAGAVRVTAACGYSSNLRGVAGAAQGTFGLGQRESVRLVALSARESTVKFVVSVRGLVTAAAGARRTGLLVTRRVRVVTARAARLPDVRVIGVQGCVAVCAGLPRTFSYGVRSMTVRALRVRSDTRRRQNGDTGVARPAGLSGLALELVRPVAPDAFGVPTREERARGHDWALGGVAALTGSERVRCRRVLVLVAGRANVLR